MFLAVQQWLMRQPPPRPTIFEDHALVRKSRGWELPCRAITASCMLLLSQCVATTPIVRAMAVHEPNMDVGALDRRVSAALRLFERQDPTAGEAELREMAEQYRWYAPPSFYLGLLSQKRQDTEIAVGFYAAALHAGMLDLNA